MYVLVKHFQIMTTSNNKVDGINLENWKVKEAITVKSEASASVTDCEKEKSKPKIISIQYLSKNLILIERQKMYKLNIFDFISLFFLAL